MSGLSIHDVLSPIVFAMVILLGLEALTHIVPLLFGSFRKIPVRGKHLDDLEKIDRLCIFVNKFLTILFVYHLNSYVSSSTTIKWKFEEITCKNTCGSLVAFYIFYDFFYTIFHRTLHHRSIYGYIHKHHHRQKAPSRGNVDAINVHPFEFLVGEYLHLVTIYFIPSHITAVVIFILAGGVLASLNHTRFDVNIPFLYSVKVHDVHHRMPESNYGQYIMLWDRLLGSFRPYNETEKT